MLHKQFLLMKCWGEAEEGEAEVGGGGDRVAFKESTCLDCEVAIIANVHSSVFYFDFIDSLL